MARAWYKSQALARATTTSTSYVDLASLTFAPAPSATYFLLWSAQSDSSSNSRNNQLRLRNDSDGTTLANPNARVSAASDDINAFGGVVVWTAGASPGSQTFIVQHSVNNSDTTIGTADTYLVALQRDAADAYVASAGTSNSSSSTLADKATLSFTPASAGDYLIVFSAELSGVIPASINGNCRALLDVNGTEYFDTGTGLASRTASQFGSWAGAVKATFGASAQTIKIRYAAADNTNAVSIRQASIVALRLDTFAGSDTGQNNSRQTTSATSPQVAASVTVSAANDDYLVFGAGTIDHGTSSSSALTKVDVAGTAASPWQHVQLGNTLQKLSSFMLGYAALSAGSRTVAFDYWSETSSTGVTDAFIGVLRPGVVVTGIDIPAGALGLAGQAPALAADRFVGIVPASLALAARMPVAVANVAAVPAPAGLAMVGLAPSIAADARLAVPAASLSLSVATPAAATEPNLAVPGVALASLGRVPTLRIDAWLQPASAGALLRAHAPARAGPLWHPAAAGPATWTDKEITAGAFALAGSVIGAYVFGAAWEDISARQPNRYDGSGYGSSY